MNVQVINSELTYDIRRRVLWPHIKNGNYSIKVDKDITTFHLGTFADNKIISVGTFVKELNSKFESNSQYRLRAMATDKKYQIKGGGRVLFLKGIEILKEKKIDILWCDARMNAIGFYQKLNMKNMPGLYNIKNIGLHQTMFINLNQ